MLPFPFPAGLTAATFLSSIGISSNIREYGIFAALLFMAQIFNGEALVLQSYVLAAAFLSRNNILLIALKRHRLHNSRVFRRIVDSIFQASTEGCVPLGLYWISEHIEFQSNGGVSGCTNPFRCLNHLSSLKCKVIRTFELYPETAFGEILEASLQASQHNASNNIHNLVLCYWHLRVLDG